MLEIRTRIETPTALEELLGRRDKYNADHRAGGRMLVARFATSATYVEALCSGTSPAEHFYQRHPLCKYAMHTPVTSKSLGPRSEKPVWHKHKFIYFWF